MSATTLPAGTPSPKTTLLAAGSLTVVRFACEAGAGAAPVREYHDTTALAFVARGSFGYGAGRYRADMVPGGTIVGRRGDDYICTHDHDCGDTCYALRLSPALEADFGARRTIWRTRGLPPVRELGAIGRLIESAAEGRSTIGVEEAAMLYAATYLRIVEDIDPPGMSDAGGNRRLAVAAALWIEEHCGEEIDLSALARQADLSPWHFLRLFSRILGVTPHQYLIGARLRRAAMLLSASDDSITEAAYAAGFADLSNFMRTFRAALGLTPRAFRKLSRGDRKILQERLAARA